MAHQLQGRSPAVATSQQRSCSQAAANSAAGQAVEHGPVCSKGSQTPRCIYSMCSQAPAALQQQRQQRQRLQQQRSIIIILSSSRAAAAVAAAAQLSRCASHLPPHSNQQLAAEPPATPQQVKAGALAASTRRERGRAPLSTAVAPCSQPQRACSTPTVSHSLPPDSLQPYCGLTN
jgi:hypothetical protein